VAAFVVPRGVVGGLPRPRAVVQSGSEGDRRGGYGRGPPRCWAAWRGGAGRGGVSGPGEAEGARAGEGRANGGVARGGARGGAGIRGRRLRCGGRRRSGCGGQTRRRRRSRRPAGGVWVSSQG